MKRWMILLLLILTACTPTATQVDPYVMVNQAQRTAEAANEKADFYSGVMTMTANAPIVAITQTSAAYSFGQTQAAGYYTATAMAWTPTPVPTATPNAAATLMMANAIAQSTKAANDAEMNDLKVERQKMSNTFWAVVLPLFLLGVLLAIGYAAISYSRQSRYQVKAGGPNGDKPLIGDVVTGEWIDMDANPNYSTGRNKDLLRQAFEQWLEQNFGFRPQLPPITAERQDEVKARDQMIDLRARAARLPKPLVDSQGMRSLPAPAANAVDGFDIFPLPKWDELMDYPFQAGGEFPFGRFAQELARINVNKYPHLGVVGPTGCGKSRLFLRPFIASALAAGNRVIVIGDMVDFVVFRMHPNATMVPIYEVTKPDDAAQYVNALAVINSEMERRNRTLTERNLSTWELMGGENTLIVLDELGPNLDILDETNQQSARALRAFLSILISKGRKAGFNFVFAGTRAVGLKKQFSQVSTIAFRLKDTDEERYAFGQSGFGAERLPESYFLSKIGSEVRMTGAFNPSDAELGDFLMRHTTKQLERPTWIEGVFKPLEQKQVSAGDDAGRLPDVIHSAADEVSSLAESIRGRWSPNMSKSAVSRLMGKPFAGNSWTAKVDNVIAYLVSTTPTTTEKLPEMGSFEPVAG